MRSGATCFAYETVTSPAGGLPLLTPMSEVAGRLAPQIGARYLERSSGGQGILLGGVAGVSPAEVVILGGGVSGTQAAAVSLGMGARVTVLDNSLPALRRVRELFGSQICTLHATNYALKETLPKADLLIGAILVPGAAAAKIVSGDLIAAMKPGSVVIDIAIDQGGCSETSRMTTHSNPTYSVNNVLHYCVANMPGIVARTSTLALSSATLPYMLAIADKGWTAACRADRHLQAGLNVHGGEITCEPVAMAQKTEFVAAERFLHAYPSCLLPTLRLLAVLQ